MKPSTSGSAFSRAISASKASSVVSSGRRSTVERKPTSPQHFSLCPTYVWLAPSFPTKTAARCGGLFPAATRASTSEAICLRRLAATSFPSMICIFRNLKFSNKPDTRERPPALPEKGGLSAGSFRPATACLSAEAARRIAPGHSSSRRVRRTVRSLSRHLPGKRSLPHNPAANRLIRLQSEHRESSRYAMKGQALRFNHRPFPHIRHDTAARRASFPYFGPYDPKSSGRRAHRSP